MGGITDYVSNPALTRGALTELPELSRHIQSDTINLCVAHTSIIVTRRTSMQMEEGEVFDQAAESEEVKGNWCCGCKCYQLLQQLEISLHEGLNRLR